MRLLPPHGSRVIVATSAEADDRRVKKMRIRRYRGERSHGMMCGLDELGWLIGGPDEVPILQGVRPGQSLDGFPPERRPEVVVEWARMVETALGAMVDDALHTSPAAAVAS